METEDTRQPVDPYELGRVWPPLTLLYESDEAYALTGDPEEWADPGHGREVLTRGIRGEAIRRTRRYLSMNGALVWARVQRSMEAADQIRDIHPPSSLVSSTTATELSMRFLVLRPMIAGLVFHTRLAMRLIKDPFGGQLKLDRELLPHACEAWNFDLDALELPNGQYLWETFISLLEVRNRYVHRSDEVTLAQALGGIDCAAGMIAQVFRPLAEQVGLAWPPDEWRFKGQQRDPVAESTEYMGS